MCLSRESLDTDGEKMCPICCEVERESVFSRICVPGNLNPTGTPRCRHQICEFCVTKVFFSELNCCPICRQSWETYFTVLKHRVRKFNGAICEVLFRGDTTGETNEYVPRCRRLLNQCGREYCLAVLSSGVKRAVYTF